MSLSAVSGNTFTQQAHLHHGLGSAQTAGSQASAATASAAPKTEAPDTGDGDEKPKTAAPASSSSSRPGSVNVLA